MSQNKTVIQGLEADNNYGGHSSAPNNNFYSRSARPAAHGTVVPGMEAYNPEAGTSKQGTATQQPQPRRVMQSGKPVVGFLYSVSRTPLGEYWPLYMGKNSIGQAPDCDIILPEGTVSSHHAVIVTRQGKSGIIAAIKDSESTNGTFINGEPIDFSAEECHGGDIITIGNNYQFLFILIDAAKLGLAVSKDFIKVDIEEPEDNDEPDIPVFNPSGGTRPGGFDPFDKNSDWRGTANYTPSNGTVGMDGSVSGGQHGGTVSM